MTKAAFALNPDNLPHRMTAAQVCELAGCSATTLWRRRRLDPTWLPAAPVQLGKSTMFDRAAVPFTPRGRWSWRQSLTADPP